MIPATIEKFLIANTLDDELETNAKKSVKEVRRMDGPHLDMPSLR